MNALSRGVLIAGLVTLLSRSAIAQPGGYLYARGRSGYDMTPAGFTTECWVQVRGLSQATQAIVLRADADNGTWWQIHVTGPATFSIGHVTPNLEVTSARRIDDGSFHHLAATYDGDAVRLYVDGALEAERQESNRNVVVGGGFIVVGGLGAPFEFDGRIDEVRIWSRCRTAGEIRAAKDAEIEPAPGLAGYWRLDRDGSDTAGANPLAPTGNVVICNCGGRIGGSADFYDPVPCSATPCPCAFGNVNAGVGGIADVLFVNGTTGDATRTVRVAVGTPLEATLLASPGGPGSARYVLWIWAVPPTREVMLDVGSSTLGCLVNPTPLQPFLTPQPFRVLAAGLPPVFSSGITPLHSPARAPWLLSQSHGFARPRTLTLQGIIEDAGSASGDGFSVTNAVELVIE